MERDTTATVKRPLLPQIPGTGAVGKALRSVSRSLADRQRFTLAGGIEALLARVSRDPTHQHRQYLYTRLATVKAKMEIEPGAVQQYPVFVINREQETDRYEIFSRRCKYLKIDFTRAPAVDAMRPDFDFKRYEKFIPDTFWGTSSFKRGIIGCYLSHAKTWEYVCEQHIDFCVILEDDAYPLIPFPKAVSSFSLPDRFDLLFVNTRTGVNLAAGTISTSTANNLFDCYPYQDVVRSMIDSGGRAKAPGADGYAISLNGAKKLLQMIAEAKICCGPDWAMALHAMTDSFRSWFIGSSDEQKKEALLTARIGDVRLDAFILLPSLIDHRPISSIVDHLNPSTWIERSAMGI